MKNNFTSWLIGLLLFAVTGLSAQITTEWLAPSVTGNDFVDIEFLDDNTGIALTKGGGIIKTVDGAATWSVRSVNSTANFTDLFVLDASNLYASTSAGHIFVSTDAGETWTSKYTGGSYNILRVFFTSQEVGYFVGNSTKHLMKTTDGGDTWASCYESTANQRSVYFSDENNGWVVGVSATAAYTTDGGTTWTASAVDPFIVLNAPTFSDVIFTDAMNGAIVGTSGTYLYSATGGAVWAGNQAGLAIASDLNSLKTDGTNIYASSLDANGVIYQSTDSGFDWSVLIAKGPFAKVYEVASDGTDSCTVNGFANAYILAYEFTSDKLIIGGLGGTYATSTDNGATWTSSMSDVFYAGVYANNVWCSEDMDSLLVTSTLTSTDPTNDPDLYRSLDGGVTWEKMEGFAWGTQGNGSPQNILVDPTDHDHIIIHGRQNKCQVSRDFGVTWVNIADDLRDGVYDSSKDNFGSDWVNDSIVILLAGDRIVASFDTANTFQTVYDTSVDTTVFTGVLSTVVGQDANTWFVACRAGTLIKTSDAGETWENITENLYIGRDSATIVTIQGNNFGELVLDPANNNNIAMVLASNQVMASSDGGETWNYYYVGGTYGSMNMTYIAEGVLWTSGRGVNYISYDNGISFNKVYIPNYSYNLEMWDSYYVGNGVIVESGAIGDGNYRRSGSAVVKFTLPEGFETLAETSTNVTIDHNADTTGFNVSWTAGNGDGCAVFMYYYTPGSTTDTLPNLTLGYDYVSSPVFTQGERSQDGWFCVYNGDGTSVEVTGFTEGMDSSQFMVYVAEYKAGNIYTLETTDGNAAYSPAFYFNEPTSSIEDGVEFMENLTVYPNPAQDQLLVSISALEAATAQVTVLDLAGKSVMQDVSSFVAGSNEQTIDISSLDSGIYFVKVQVAGQIMVQRFIKE